MEIKLLYLNDNINFKKFQNNFNLLNSINFGFLVIDPPKLSRIFLVNSCSGLFIESTNTPKQHEQITLIIFILFYTFV
jgi:hypothetical protein